MTKFGGGTEIADFLSILRLVIAVQAIAGREPQGSNSTGPVELPTADASQAGFSVRIE